MVASRLILAITTPNIFAIPIRVKPLQIAMVLALLLGSALPTNANAQSSYSWIPGSEIWNKATSWSPGGIPGPDDDALFDTATGGTDQILWGLDTANQGVNQLLVTAGDYRINHTVDDGAVFKINSTGDDAFRIENAGTIFSIDGLEVAVADSRVLVGTDATLNLGIGDNGLSATLAAESLVTNGFVNVTESKITSLTGTIGRSGGERGAVSLIGGNARWDLLASEGLLVGRSGIGNLTLNDGAQVGTTNLSLGLQSGSKGTIGIASGSKMNVSSSLQIGVSASSGILNASVGSTIQSGNTSMGVNANSLANVTISDSSWDNTGTMIVGQLGNADLTIDSGSVVQTESAMLASGVDSVASIDLNGTGSRLNVNDTLTIAESGAATVNIAGGAELRSRSVFAGTESGSNASINIEGANSRWHARENMLLGGTSSNDGGQVDVDVSAGGLLRVGNDTAYLSGTSVIVGDFNGNGNLNLRYRTNLRSESMAYVGLSENSVGNVNISGQSANVPGRWHAAGGLSLGGTETADGGIGHVTFSERGVLVVGDGPAQLGTLDFGSRLFVNGDEGTNQLTIRNGSTINVGTAAIGRYSQAGKVLVHGSNSALNVSSSYIGFTGDGMLTIESGGRARLYNSAVLGQFDWTTGTVVVSGDGSRLETNSVTIGEDGTGILSVLDQALAISSTTILGNEVDSSGTANIADSGSQWQTLSLTVGRLGTGAVSITNQGQVSSSNRLTVGADDGGLGNLSLESGGTLTNTGTADIAALTGATGNVMVSGSGSTWSNIGDLNIGGTAESSGGSGTLTVESGGLVTVDGNTRVWDSGSVMMQGGRFEFGRISSQDFQRIGGTAGQLAGVFENEATTALSSYTLFQNHPLDLTDVYLNNTGLLYGSAIDLGASINNQVGGELLTTAGELVYFRGTLDNESDVNIFGGTLRFDEAIINRSGGFIQGRGVLITDQLTNQGIVAISGDTDIVGDAELVSGSQWLTSGNSTTTFFGDVIHNGDEIRTTAGSSTVFYGQYSGAGSFTGTGDVFFDGDLRPGNSPDTVLFEGNVTLGESALTEIELAGLLDGEFDRLLVDGDFSVDGQLAVSLIDGFQLKFGDQFLISEIGGNRTGYFQGLSEGDLVGQFSGLNLYISYRGGDGNDILLSAVPEPGTGIVLVAGGLLALLKRRKKSQP